MGSTRWDPDDWKSYSTKTASMSTSSIYRSTSLKNELDPKGIVVRESCDSDANPNSNAIIVALDVTGSMGELAGVIARKGLGVLVENIYTKKPVTDPHIMLMGIGDAWCDRAPLQVTQFEADVKPLTEQLEKLYLESGGGGNHFESYNLPWYFAAQHTSIDCFKKRGKKGYLFTVGDEEPPPTLVAAHVRKIMGDELTDDIPTKELLTMVNRTYNVIHVVVEEGNYARGRIDHVMAAWREIMGQNVIRLSDHTKLAEVIESAIEVIEGADKDKVAKAWGGGTSVVVARAVGDLISSGSGKSGGVVRL